MKPYREPRYGHGKSFANANKQAIHARLTSLIPKENYGSFRGKPEGYAHFAGTVSSGYDKFVQGLAALHKKPRYRSEAVAIAQEVSGLLGLKQFAQVAELVEKDLDLEAKLDECTTPASGKSTLVNYLRQCIPKNVEAVIEFYERGKLIDSHTLDANRTISVRNLPDMAHGRVSVTVIEKEIKYKADFTFRRQPLDSYHQEHGWKPEEMPFDIIAKPAILEKRL